MTDFPLPVIQSLFRNPHLSSAIQSVIARVVVSSLISLPRMASSSLSDDPALMQRVNKKIQEFCVVIGTGTTSIMSKTLPFVIESAFSSDDLEVGVPMPLVLPCKANIASRCKAILECFSIPDFHHLCAPCLMWNPWL